MKRASLTTWSIVALVIGLALGTVGHRIGAPGFDLLGVWSKTIGGLWIAALQLTVLPLVITQLLATITGAGAKSVGKLGLQALLLFVAMLIASGLFAIVLTPLLVTKLSFDPGTPAALAAAASAPGGVAAASAGPNAAPTSTPDWIGSLLPTNLFEAALKGDIFPLLLFTGCFALAVTRLSKERY